MEATLAELFDNGPDFDLCNGLFSRLCTLYGNGADVSAMREEERTVYLVWGALGIIGNGGFRYLFEAELSGDPHFALTRHAFETIGCSEAVEAFTQAFAAFPDQRPPANSAKRLRAYIRRMPSFPSAADRLFFGAQGAVARFLANWVRSRQRAFGHLT